jgi:hypothetical protein
MNRQYLVNKIYEYDEVIEMLNDDLKDINLKSFCLEHGLRYTTVWQVLTKYKNKKYPKIVSKLMKIMGYNTIEVIAYKFIGIDKP